MILTSRHGRLRVVTQNDHAHLAAEMLALFRRPELVEHPRRGDLLRAVRLHDNGWREADAAPRVDPGSGRPYSYRDLPAAVRREVWERGSRRYLEEDPYVAALVSRHALALLAARREDPDWEELLELLDEREEEASTAAGLAPDEAAADYAWLALADVLSLALCEGWEEPFGEQGWRGEVRGDTLHLDPFPLAGATTFTVPARLVADALPISLRACRRHSTP